MTGYDQAERDDRTKFGVPATKAFTYSTVDHSTYRARIGFHKILQSTQHLRLVKYSLLKEHRSAESFD